MSGTIDGESSADLELGLSMHHGIIYASSTEKRDAQSAVDLELRLASGHSESETSLTYQSSAVREGSTPDRQQRKWTVSSVQQATWSKDYTFSNQTAASIEPSSTVSDSSSCVLTTSKTSVTSFSEVTQSPPHPCSSASKTCQIEGCGKGARGAKRDAQSAVGFFGKPTSDPPPHQLIVSEGPQFDLRTCKYLGSIGELLNEFCGLETTQNDVVPNRTQKQKQQSLHSFEFVDLQKRKKKLLSMLEDVERRYRHYCDQMKALVSSFESAAGEGAAEVYLSLASKAMSKHFRSLKDTIVAEIKATRKGTQSTGPCNSFARGKTGMCALHNGLVQDKMVHGNERCIFDGCDKSAQGSTEFCREHSCGKDCTFPGCAKVVHGGTNFCVTHDGGNSHYVPMKSARGRTEFGVCHDGGKRCKFERCGKSPQGSTGCNMTLGGENRCSWGRPWYSLQPTDPCKSYAMGKVGLCVIHSKVVQDERVHCSVSKLYLQHLRKLLGLPHSVYPSISLAVNLRAECIKELYLCCTATAHLQGLVNLQQVDLRNSNFTRMPDLSDSRKLQTLDLRGCKNLVDVSTVQYLTELKYLNLKGCTSLMRLPSLMALKLLSSIDLSDCKHLTRLPPSLGFLSCLTTLDLRNCKRIQALPKSILRLKSLEVLSISGCSMLMERVSRVAISSSVDTGLMYPPCSTAGSDSMIFEHQESRGHCNSLLRLVEGIELLSFAEISSSNQRVSNDVLKASSQLFEEARPCRECDSKGKLSLERRTSYEMELTGSEDAFNPSSVDQDLKWTSDHRNALNGYLNMPVEAIHQANAFDKVAKTTEILILQCYNIEESESLHSLLYCLSKLQESVPETMEHMNEARFSSASLQVKLAGLGSSLVQEEEEYSLLADEFSRVSEEEAELDAEIQRLLAKRDELLHDDNNTIVIH